MKGATLRRMILDGYEVTLYCATPRCGRSHKVDLPAMARLKGLDWVSSGPPWPFRCTMCGSRDNKMIVSPDTRNMRSDDYLVDARARKKLVEEIERELAERET